MLTGKFHDHPELLRGIGWRKFNPLFKQSGLTKSLPVVNMVKELARKYDATLSQVALNWLIHYHGGTMVAIPGATKEAHARENAGAMSFRLSEEDMAKLDRVSAVFK